MGIRICSLGELLDPDPHRGCGSQSRSKISPKMRQKSAENLKKNIKTFISIQDLFHQSKTEKIKKKSLISKITSYKFFFTFRQLLNNGSGSTSGSV